MEAIVLGVVFGLIGCVLKKKKCNKVLTYYFQKYVFKHPVLDSQRLGLKIYMYILY